MWTLLIGTALSSDLVEAESTRARADREVDEVLARFAHEPSVEQVQAWAVERVRASDLTLDGWLRSSRGFAALPEFRVEYRFDDGWDQDFSYRALDGFVDSPDDTLFASLEDAGRDQDHSVKLRATWDLDELVMSSERIRVLNEVQDLVKLRNDVLSEVTRVYFERRRLQARGVVSAGGSVADRVRDELRVRELTARLDALTGGRFSDELSRDGR